jgi:biopolymer transport protein ExbD
LAANMKFRRNLPPLSSRLDVAPFAAVFFLLVIFMLLRSLVYTPGVHLQLPRADNLSGTDKPTVRVAIDAGGRFYYENHIYDEKGLKAQLQTAVKQASKPMALVVLADKAVTIEMLDRLLLVAREAGISEALQATLPRTFTSQ